MLWGEAQDQGLLAYFKTLIGLRRGHPALIYGEFITHYLDDAQGVWLLERSYQNDHMLLAINVSHLSQMVALPMGAWQKVNGTVISEKLAAPARQVAILVRAS
jgi:glycosidase